MGFRDRSVRFQGVNMYVPAMVSAAALLQGAPSPFSLGTPAAVSANNIATATAANATAGTQVAYTYVADSTYGRTLRLTISGDPGNSVAIDIFGEDYLGQPMAERFTGASGATAILYGKKAFYRVLYSKVVTASSNAVTWAIGTGWRFGLPYKGDVAWAKEAGVFVPLYKRDFWTYREIAGAAVGGGPSGSIIKAPCPGFVKTLSGSAEMPAGSTNDPAVTVKLGGTAITGLTVTPDTSAAGTIGELTDTPTTTGYIANNRFRAGDLIELVAADADTSGAIVVGLEITPTQASLPVLTDPQTLTTGDPRGTYESIMTPDGASEIIVALHGDNSKNSSGNGGLHGIRHVVS